MWAVNEEVPMRNSDGERVILAEVIRTAWAAGPDRDALRRDPVTVLREAGLDVPQGQTVTVLEDTPSVRHLVIPADPTEEITQQVLSLLAQSIPLPDGVEVRLHQNTDTQRFLVLPLPLGEDASLNDEILGLVVGGNGGNGGAGGTGGLFTGNAGNGGLFIPVGGVGGNGGDGGVGWIG